ncbi:zinc ribbon domain-containing protein [Embleya sp. NPDC020886]|uniref:zinc ribbon domain-containing protein n=1 Tax=Embleya sp. NPDC020886 TaxID=3363980 RepID=UPI00379222F8
MPRYDYRCRACGLTYELNRPMSAANDPATCPDGHTDSTKLLSTVAVATGASAPSTGGGGCCGGGCCA